MFLRVLNVQRRGGLNRFGGVRNLFIQTSSTPNPNGLKFQPAGKEVLPEEYGSSMVRSFETRKRFQTYSTENPKTRVQDFRNLAQAQVSPLARRLFATPGVEGVFFGHDFITVTKDEDTAWEILKLDVFSVVMDFYAEGIPVISPEAERTADNLAILDDDSEVVAMIKELLGTRIRPAVRSVRA